MRRVWAQSEKEWKQFRRDPLSMLLAVAMPPLMVLLFGYTLSLEPDQLRVVIQDLDQSPLSRSYIAMYEGANDFGFRPWPLARPAVEALESGEAEMALVIPPHFGRDLLRGVPARAQALIDGTDANTALWVRQTAEALNAKFASEMQGAGAPPIETRIRFWYNPGLSDRQFFGTGALGMVLIFFPALLGGISASREHEMGTVVQAYASTLSSVEWTLGKCLPYIAVGVAELAIGYAAGAWHFGYKLPWDTTAFLAASIAYIAIGVLFGMLVGHETKSQSVTIQAVQLGVFLLSLLLSGFLAPLENIPGWIRWMSWFIPARYYVEVVRDVLLRQGGWIANGPEAAILTALALAVFAANVIRMRRMRLTD